MEIWTEGTVTDSFSFCMWTEIHVGPIDDNMRGYTGKDWKKMHIHFTSARLMK